MNLEEYKKHVDEVSDNIENLLKDNEEELSFYHLLTNAFNKVCEERNNLEQALNEIEKYIEEYQEERTYTDRGGFTCVDGHFLRDSDDLLEIIQEAKLGNFHYRCNSNVKVSSKEDTIIYQMPEN